MALQFRGHDPLPRARRISSIVLLASVLAAVTPSIAQGHAIVVFARPALNAVLAPGAIDIELRFNSRLDHQRSRLMLHAPDGTLTAVAPKPDSAPDTLAARAELEAPGAWKLEWSVLSLDGHVTRGDVRFSVRDGASKP